MCDHRRGFDRWIWFIDRLYTQYPELQAITAQPLNSTIRKSPRHPLSFFQPAMSSPAVPWQRLLTVEILHLHALKSCLSQIPIQNSLSTEPVPYL
jgi:hypothetical protein